MHWNEFLLQQLEQETAIDKLFVSIREEKPAEVPAILKASILISDNLLQTGNLNMIVFPERQVSSYLFMLFKTIFNISEGRIESEYNPYTFIPGEKLKFRDFFMEFIEVSVEDGVERIYVKFAEGMKYGVPLEAAPYLQRADSKRLSRYESFYTVFNPFMAGQIQESSKPLIQNLADLKTHLGSSSVYVSSIIKAKNMLLETKINGIDLTKFLLLSQANPYGRISNMTSGQLSGNPALVLCQDLYVVNEAINNGLSTNLIFIEANQNTLDNQLDALDDLIQQKKTIFLLTDHVSYNDYSNLEVRNFRIWTWNDSNISQTLYRDIHSQINVRVRNAATRKIEYIDVARSEIDKTIDLLYKHKTHIDNKSSVVIRVFQDLFEISLLMLRAVAPIMNIDYLLDVINKCELTLTNEKPYMSESMFLDFMVVIDNIRNTFNDKELLPKILSFNMLLTNTVQRNLIIVIPPKKSKENVEQHIKNILSNEIVELIVLYPNEYLLHTQATNSLTVVSGWLGKSIMSRILNTHVTADITILLYDCEKRWKNGYVRSTVEFTRNVTKNNAGVLSHIDRNIQPLATMEPSTQYTATPRTEGFIDLDDIDLTLRQHRYRDFVTSTIENSVDAVPVSFVGDLMAFYKTSRKLLTATKLINEDGDNTEEINPSSLQVGDFVIERGAQRDLIKDVADVILMNSGNSDMRKAAGMWKEALRIAVAFSSEEEVYKKLQAAGCTRSRAALRVWLYSESNITPQSKDDIKFIAIATEDAVLLETVDKVYNAGRLVKNAHISAGHYLAEKLRFNLSSSLTLMESIDGFNVWEPIDVYIEDIGNIKILKVIDVGDRVTVDAINTNRLIDTNRVTM